jgi:hypothetical protein
VSYNGFGEPLSVAVGDVNKDGLPDIVVADSTTATLMVQSATSPGTFEAAVQVGG